VSDVTKTTSGVHGYTLSPEHPYTTKLPSLWNLATALPLTLNIPWLPNRLVPPQKYPWVIIDVGCTVGAGLGAGVGLELLGRLEDGFEEGTDDDGLLELGAHDDGVDDGTELGTQLGTDDGNNVGKVVGQLDGYDDGREDGTLLGTELGL
jgi:hypothetical protein